MNSGGTPSKAKKAATEASVRGGVTNPPLNASSLGRAMLYAENTNNNDDDDNDIIMGDEGAHLKQKSEATLMEQLPSLASVLLVEKNYEDNVCESVDFVNNGDSMDEDYIDPDL
jgi:hypothetical protein